MDGRKGVLGSVAGLVALVVLCGTLFYMIHLEMDPVEAVYLTVMTIATVGYGDVSPLSRAKELGISPVPAELFTVLLIFAGMGVLAYCATLLTEFIVSGDYARARAARRLRRRIDALSGHVVVCGPCRLSEHVLAELERSRRPFVVVEPDEARLRERLARRPDLLHVIGDPGDERILSLAGVERCAGVLLADPDERENLLVTLTARALCEAAGRPVPRIVARVADLERAGPRLLSSGADSVVSPSFIGGRRMVSELLKPRVTTVLDRMLADPHATVRIDEAPVAAVSPYAGRTLAELSLPSRERVSVLSCLRGERFSVVPGADFRLEAGDTLILLGECGDLARVRTIAAGAAA